MESLVDVDAFDAVVVVAELHAHFGKLLVAVEDGTEAVLIPFGFSLTLFLVEGFELEVHGWFVRSDIFVFELVDFDGLKLVDEVDEHLENVLE